MKALFYIYSLTILLLLVPFLCFAQETQEKPDSGVQVSPLRFDWTLVPGATRSDEITVHNFSHVNREIEIEVENFYVSEDSSKAFFYSSEESENLMRRDISDWFTVPEKFVLAPGETKQIPFHIAIPDDQATRGHYGAIFFKTRSDADVMSDKDDARINVNYRVGTLITLVVQGDEPMRLDGSLEEFSVNRLFFFRNPVDFMVRLSSKGNVPYKINGKIDIFRFGKKYASIIISPELMYPDKERTIYESLHFDQFDIGVYNALLELQSEDGDVYFEGRIPCFIIVPWQLASLFVFILLLGIICITFFKKNYKIVKKDHENDTQKGS